MEEENGYLRACYQVLLNREPDGSAIATWGNAGTDGAVLRSVLEAIVSSAEFHDKRMDFLARYGGLGNILLLNDHSQFGEVSLLLRHAIKATVGQGVVVDVGANGRARSNSYDLLHDFGWKGLLIEANPARNPVIAAEFLGCDYTLVNCAVSNYAGEAVFHLGVNDDVSSLVAGTAAAWGDIRGEVSVKVDRLPAILEAHGVPVDFELLSIDAEGEDIRILNDTVASGYRPRWIIIEASHNFTISRLDELPVNDDVKRYYVVVDRTPANLILQRSEDSGVLLPGGSQVDHQ